MNIKRNRGRNLFPHRCDLWMPESALGVTPANRTYVRAVEGMPCAIARRLQEDSADESGRDAQNNVTLLFAYATLIDDGWMVIQVDPGPNYGKCTEVKGDAIFTEPERRSGAGGTTMVRGIETPAPKRLAEAYSG